MGLAAAKSDGLWGFLAFDGTWAIPPSYLEAFGFTKEGLAQVRLKDESWTWIDRTGATIWDDPTDPSIILRNDFQKDAEPWTIGESDTIKTALTQGFYYIKAKQATGGLSAIPLEFDRDGDYAISVKLRYNSSNSTDGVGVVWDIEDLGNFYAFVIAPQGGYAVVRFKGGQPDFLVPWTLGESINKGMVDNNVEIRHAVGELEFLVNGTKLTALPYETIYGQGIGFACFGATSLIVDELTVSKAW